MKIAIYFAWLGHYTWALIVPAVAGTALFLLCYWSTQVGSPRRPPLKHLGMHSGPFAISAGALFFGRCAWKTSLQKNRLAWTFRQVR